jgi:hypothetical protein
MDKLIKYFAPITIMVVLFLSGCYEVTEVNVPFNNPSLVINSVFTPDSSWAVSVTLNQQIFDKTDFKTVDDAMVTISENNVPVETLKSTGNGRYKSENKPVAGRSYEITVNSSKYGVAKANSFIPLPVQLMEAEVVQAGTATGSDALVKIRFQDVPSTTNYYQLVILWQGSKTVVTGWSSTQELKTSQTTTVDSKDPAISIRDEIGSSILAYGDGYSFKDSFFDGQETELTFSCRYFADAQWTDQKLVIMLRSISEEMFLYKRTMLLQYYFEGDPFSQPVHVFNNIENGYGIFAGYSVHTVERNL